MLVYQRVMNGYEWGLVDLTITMGPSRCDAAICCDAVHRDMVVPFPLQTPQPKCCLFHVIPVWTKIWSFQMLFFGGLDGFHMISHESKKPISGLRCQTKLGLLLAPLPQADDAAFANELDFSYEVGVFPTSQAISQQDTSPNWGVHREPTKKNRKE